MGEQAKIEVEMTAEMSNLWRSFQTIAKEAGKAEGAIRGTSKAIDQAAKDQEKLNRAGRRLEEDMRTPQERYKARIAELDTMLKKSTISQETYNRAVKVTREEYDRVANSRDNAFGGAGLAQLRSFALQVVGIHEVVRLIVTGIQSVNQEMKTLAERQMQGAAATGEMLTISQTDPARFKRLIALRNSLMREGAATDYATGAEAAFAIDSAQASEEWKLFADLKSWYMVKDIRQTAGAMQTMRTTIGTEKTGTRRDLWNKAIGAAEPSPASPEEVMIAAAKAASEAGTMAGPNYAGATEDILAMASLMSIAKFSPEQGGTYMAQMYRTLMAKGAFTGMPLKDIALEVNRMWQGGKGAKDYFETKGGEQRLTELFGDKDRAKQWMENALNVDKQRDMGMPVGDFDEWSESLYESTPEVKGGMSMQEFKKWFGRAQGQQAMMVLIRDLLDEKGGGIFEASRAKAVTAAKEDYLTAQLEMAAATPELAVSRMRVIQTNRAELGAQDRALYENVAEALKSELTTQWRAKHGSEAELRRKAVEEVRDVVWTLQGAKKYVSKWGYLSEDPAMREMIYQGMSDEQVMQWAQTVPWVKEKVERDLGGPIPTTVSPGFSTGLGWDQTETVTPSLNREPFATTPEYLAPGESTNGPLSRGAQGSVKPVYPGLSRGAQGSVKPARGAPAAPSVVRVTPTVDAGGGDIPILMRQTAQMDEQNTILRSGLGAILSALTTRPSGGGSIPSIAPPVSEDR